MAECLLCDDPLSEILSWQKFIFGSLQQNICHSCYEQFILIEGSTCTVCSRPCQEATCSDCQQWAEFYQGEDPLSKNISLFQYNEAMQRLITQWKYRGDYVLGTIFRERFITTFHKHFAVKNHHLSVVPIPLSKQRMEERRFNQARMLAQFLTPNVEEIFIRVDDTKQAKKTRRERMQTKNPFKLVKKLNNSVVLVDDIYTTGRTIRHAAELLQQHGISSVYSITLVRG